MEEDVTNPPAPPPTSKELRELGVELRMEQPEDAVFLERLFAAVRWEQFRPLPLPDSAKHALLAQQHAMQRQQYRSNYPDGAFWLVLRRGTPVGRLCVHRTGDEQRIVDIALLPEAQGCGTGAALLRAIQEDARAANVPVTLHVERSNPARELYVRLGFVLVREEGSQDFMQWSP